MNDKTIAYCGLICSECPAYVATQADDWEALERTAAQWRKQFNEPSITADSVVCDHTSARKPPSSDVGIRAS